MQITKRWLCTGAIALAVGAVPARGRAQNADIDGGRGSSSACASSAMAPAGEPLAYAEGIVTICRRHVENPLMSVAVSAVPTSRLAPMRFSPIGSA